MLNIVKNDFLVWYCFGMIFSMTNSHRFFLGIDGGGSKCRARIRDVQGRKLAEAVGGSSNIYQDYNGSIANIVAVATEAAKSAGVAISDLHAGLGLAGIVTSVGAEKIQTAELPFASVIADNDAFVACLGAFGGDNGGIVIAGTGSIGLGIVDGQRHMVGGWGFQLGDHGSGAWLGSFSQIACSSFWNVHGPFLILDSAMWNFDSLF